MTLEISHLCKKYGTSTVLDDVSIRVGAGEILAVLGPNGAGKSTLIACLSGATSPTSGEIRIAGVVCVHETPRSAREAGIAVIYQHLSLVGSLDAVDNIFLGEETRKYGMINRRAERERARALLNDLGVQLDVTRPVEQLSTGERQLIEIAKALRSNPRILILDEPTAALGMREVDALLKVVKNLANTGMAIIYVTHLLEEVLTLANRVTILRDGKVVLDSEVEGMLTAELVEAISPGTHAAAEAAPYRREGAPTLEVNQINGSAFGPLSVDIGKGEVVCLFGLLGSGRTEILESLVGARTLQSGALNLNNRTFNPRSPAGAGQHGVYLVPADRIGEALFGDLRCDDNVLVPSLARLRHGFRNRSREAVIYDVVAAQLDVRPRRAELRADLLSGGNQQKMMIARWVHKLSRPDVLLLDEPTQGVDVGARRDIYRRLRELATRSGTSILFTTSDPEEVIASADRCLVLHRGIVVDEMIANETTHDRLLRAAHHTTAIQAA